MILFIVNMKYSKILIIRLSAAGDIVLTFPAFFFLAEKIAGAKIDWAVDERFADLPSLLPGLNKKIVFPARTLKSPKASYASKIAAAWNFIREIRREKYDLVIDFQGLFKSGAISFLSKASVRAAFAPGGHDSREMNHWLNNKIISVPEGGPLAAKIIYRSLYLAALASDQTPPGDYTMKRLVEPERGNPKITSFFDEIKGLGRADKIIAINPFTNWPTKTWPADKWMELIKLIRRDDKLKNYAVAVLWGPAEKEAAERIAASDELSFISPPTTFREVFGVLDGADAVISGDSFALHAAFVLNKPAVAVFGASDPARCAPFGDRTAVVTRGLECQHCFKKTCRLATDECIKSVDPAAVLEALRRVV